MATTHDSDGEAQIEVGDRVRVCHKRMRVVEVFRGSGDVTLRGELAGVHGQQIVTTTDYARAHRVDPDE